MRLDVPEGILNIGGNGKGYVLEPLRGLQDVGDAHQTAQVQYPPRAAKVSASAVPEDARARLCSRRLGRCAESRWADARELAQ